MRSESTCLFLYLDDWLVVLGLDGSSPPKDATTGAEVFASKDARELAQIPGEVSVFSIF